MFSSTLLAVASAALASAHTIITYPGWRGNSLITNETFPYGMQWMYPCGGMPTTTNRTFWPTTGGAVAFQPGWFQGHNTAFIYINLGYGNEGPELRPDLAGPPNMSHPMITPFQILGPNKGPYPGTFCLPQVRLPAGFEAKAGDNATIQVVELAQHGAALYSCVDITFAEPGDKRIAKVNETNCFNSTDLGVADIYTLTLRASGETKDISTSGAASRAMPLSGGALAYLGYLPLLLGGLWVLV
ncbi:hypothetical protein C8A00DRAFT_36240 [Chaetomidium leptoderma]|uniref:Copper acquisition factor BIM1-like domain-containing protein n=1 Tax=Chaetomidium leptoderma TaxID=669021 RepID=A0AAN6VH20_9PEZI|nr:hypothetical protein C8A00DRAFT_36240 [Chaetomidium leptoderma]